MRRKLSFILVTFIAVLAAGCPSLWKADIAEKDPGPDKLFQAAEDQFQKKQYGSAVDMYERLKSGYPDFKKMPEVYLKIADALYDEQSYDKSIARYQQFIDLYPGNKEVSRAKFNIGMAYFSQIKNTDLDNSVVQTATAEFKALAADSNAGEWAKKAEEKYNECRKKLAEKEMYKARTMLTVGNYQAARLAAKRVLDDYPKLGFDNDASDLIKSIKGK
ncbi:MAG: outer membrane protein assembly factor BamD [Desulfomonilaceae bacterium]